MTAATTWDARARVEEIAGWLGEHGTLPRSSGSSLLPGERTLGKWLGERRVDPNLTVELATLLDDRVPHWRDPNAARWWAAAEQVAAFRATYGGELPRADGEGLAAEEKVLGEWLRTQRRRQNLTSAQAAFLDRCAPAWRDAAAAAWEARADQVITFHARFGRMPRKTGRPSHEMSLAEWVRWQKREGLSPDRARYLDQHLPGWRDGNKRTDQPPALTSRRYTMTRTATPAAWIDKHGDVWVPGDDGLLHTPETAPFPAEYVERKWGPLEPVPAPQDTAAFTSWLAAHDDEVRRQTLTDAAAAAADAFSGGSDFARDVRTAAREAILQLTPATRRATPNGDGDPTVPHPYWGNRSEQTCWVGQHHDAGMCRLAADAPIHQPMTTLTPGAVDDTIRETLERKAAAAEEAS